MMFIAALLLVDIVPKCLTNDVADGMAAHGKSNGGQEGRKDGAEARARDRGSLAF